MYALYVYGKHGILISQTFLTSNLLLLTFIIGIVNFNEIILYWLHNVEHTGMHVFSWTIRLVYGTDFNLSKLVPNYFCEPIITALAN